MPGTLGAERGPAERLVRGPPANLGRLGYRDR